MRGRRGSGTAERKEVATKKQASGAAKPEADTRGDRTRLQIKRVIARLASKKDVADITLADICSATKLTTGAIYFHFGGKDEAIEEMVVDEVRMLYDQLVGNDDEGFEHFVARLIGNSTRYHQKTKGLPRAIAVVINTRPKAYAAWLEARRPVVRRLQDLIAEARSKAGLGREEAPYLAHFILNSIEDIAMDVFSWQNPTLMPFASTPEAWNKRQTALWSWAILAPFPAGLSTE